MSVVQPGAVNTAYGKKLNLHHESSQATSSHQQNISQPNAFPILQHSRKSGQSDNHSGYGYGYEDEEEEQEQSNHIAAYTREVALQDKLE